MSHITINPQTLYYGFPVILLTTVDAVGKSNISPISSSWSLGNKLVIGIGSGGKAYDNIKAVPEVVLNIASTDLMQNVEKIAKYTSKYLTDKNRDMGYSFSDDKFSIGAFTKQKSVKVKPYRIRESKLQLEARVEHITVRDWFAIIELEVILTHADESILNLDNNIDPLVWNPLIYNFRSYHGLSEQIGTNFRFES